MAVYTYNVTLDQVYNYLSIDTSQIGPTSDVTPAMITQFIEDASGEITGALKNAGLAYMSLGDDELVAVRRAIAQYAASQTYRSIGWYGSGAKDAEAAYNKVLKRYQDTPQALGAGGVTIRSNVNTSCPRRRIFGRDYES